MHSSFENLRNTGRGGGRSTQATRYHGNLGKPNNCPQGEIGQQKQQVGSRMEKDTSNNKKEIIMKAWSMSGTESNLTKGTKNIKNTFALFYINPVFGSCYFPHSHSFAMAHGTLSSIQHSK